MFDILEVLRGLSSFALLLLLIIIVHLTRKVYSQEAQIATLAGCLLEVDLSEEQIARLMHIGGER